MGLDLFVFCSRVSFPVLLGFYFLLLLCVDVGIRLCG